MIALYVAGLIQSQVTLYLSATIGTTLVSIASEAILLIAPKKGPTKTLRALEVVSEIVLPFTLTILLGIATVIIGHQEMSDSGNKSLVPAFLLLYLPLAATIAAGPRRQIKFWLLALVPLSFIFATLSIQVPNKPVTTVIYLVLITSTTVVLDGLSTRIRKDLQRRLEQQTKTQQSALLWSNVAQRARRIASLHSSDKILEEVVAATSALGFELATICQINHVNQTLRFSHPYGLPKKLIDKDHPIQGITEVVLNARQSAISDYSQLLHASPTLTEMRLRTTVGIPLWVNGEVAAVLAGGTVDVREILSEELAALELLAATASSALEQQATTTELISKLNRLHEMLENAPNPTIAIDKNNSIILANKRASLLFGYEEVELTKRSLSDLVRIKNNWHLSLWTTQNNRDLRPYETTAISSDQSMIEVEITASRLTFADTQLISLAFRDITEQKRHDATLSGRGSQDIVTGLPNRQNFLRHLRKTLTSTGAHDDPVTVAVFEVEKPRSPDYPNQGPTVDEVAIEIAVRLDGHIRDSDTLARLSADKFALIAENLSSASALNYLRRLLTVSSQPLMIKGSATEISVHFGVAFGSSEHKPEILLRNANSAMLKSKKQGDPGIAFFDEAIIATATERLEIEADLINALKQNQFSLKYQPIISLTDGHTSSVEALIRWNRPSKGVVSPDHFIPIAEDTGLIRAIGTWTLSEACRQYARWREQLGNELNVAISVNVSRLQLHPDLIVENVRSALQETKMAPQNLIIEITETALLTDTTSAFETLDQLSKLNVQIAIDDFGTGYSSLSMLTSVPVNILKIDKSFIDQLGTRSDITVEAVLRLAEQLDLMVIAEGVETIEQAERLRVLGCKYAQGFLYSEPIEPSQIAGFLANRL